MENENQGLLNKMYATKSARFNADNRLRLEHQLAHYSMMIAAVYVVVLTLAENYLPFPLVPHSEFISLCLSVLLIGIASFEAGNDRLLEAYFLHENALEINALYDKCLFSETSLEIISDEFNKIKSKCKYNHSESDYLWHVLNNKDIDFLKIRIYALLKLIPFIAIHYGMYLLIIIAPIVISFIYLNSYTAPST